VLSELVGSYWYWRKVILTCIGVPREFEISPFLHFIGLVLASKVSWPAWWPEVMPGCVHLSPGPGAVAFMGCCLLSLFAGVFALNDGLPLQVVIAGEATLPARPNRLATRRFLGVLVGFAVIVFADMLPLDDGAALLGPCAPGSKVFRGAMPLELAEGGFARLPQT